MQKKIGFIGCGNMGSAILKGMLAANVVSKEEILVATRTQASADNIYTLYGVDVTNDSNLVAKSCPIILLAIKPNMYLELIASIKEEAKDALIISVAAGVSITKLHEYFENPQQKIVRAMPNTPACVNMAMSSLSFNAFVSEEEKTIVKHIFASFGKYQEVEEELIHAVIGVSGSSPAYVFMMLDAMIQNGIKHGLSKKEATHFATQAMMGAAKMVADLDVEPDRLKQNVCSPNGTTIEAVHTLEKMGFKEAIDEAMDACIARSKEMSK